jgi:hypothetical protein
LRCSRSLDDELGLFCERQCVLSRLIQCLASCMTRHARTPTGVPFINEELGLRAYAGDPVGAGADESAR